MADPEIIETGLTRSRILARVQAAKPFETMATRVSLPPSRLEPAISSLLAALRRRIRAYLWVDGVAAVLVLLGARFWISLAIDWLFEPPRPLRAVALVVMTVALGFVVFRWLVARLFVRLEDRNLALVLERRFSGFHDSLLTAVELADEPEHAAEFNREMLAHTHRDATARAAEVDLRAVFNAAPLARRISLALALIGALLAFAFAAPEAAAVWARRNVLLSDELWPRQTHLSVDGFDAQGHSKIARGTDFQLIVKADAAVDRLIPDIVEVRYSTAEGARGRENMSREGVVAPGQAPFQEYAHTFKSVLAPLDFHVVGGDDRQGPFHLDVVDSPTLSRMTLHCEYPAYMHRAPRDVPVAGLMQLPRGTQVTIWAEANKPLVKVQIDDVADETTPVTRQLDVAVENGTPQSSFQFELPRLDADKTLLFTLRDADGIRSREAVRLALAAVADEPPAVNVQLKGIGTAITAQARLPAAGEVSDDYGVSRIWFELAIDEAPPQQQPFPSAVDGQEKLAVAGTFEVRDLQLQPKQKLHFAVQAADSFTLDAGPNVGGSQRYVLDVVAPEQLRSMLEARELMLRRRFETIIEELTDTRNLLAGLATGTKPPATRVSAEKPAEAAAPARAWRPGGGRSRGRRFADAASGARRAKQPAQRSRNLAGRAGVRRHPRGDDQQPRGHRGVENPA